MRAPVMALFGIVVLLAGARASADPATAETTPTAMRGPMVMVPQAIAATQSTTMDSTHSQPAPAGVIPVETPAISTASSVMAIQRALSRLGYDPGPADGIMGGKTKGAIAAYEEDKGWDSSGAIGQRLQDQLAVDLAAPGRPAEPVQAAKPAGGGAATQAAVQAALPVAFPRPGMTARRGADYAEESRRVAAAEQRGPLETAVIEFFNAVRDMTVFVVRSMVDETSTHTEVAVSN